jgi:hypothetical protein
MNPQAGDQQLLRPRRQRRGTICLRQHQSRLPEELGLVLLDVRNDVVDGDDQPLAGAPKPLHKLLQLPVLDQLDRMEVCHVEEAPGRLVEQPLHGGGKGNVDLIRCSIHRPKPFTAELAGVRRVPWEVQHSGSGHGNEAPSR